MSSGDGCAQNILTGVFPLSASYLEWKSNIYHVTSKTAGSYMRQVEQFHKVFVAWKDFEEGDGVVCFDFLEILPKGYQVEVDCKCRLCCYYCDDGSRSLSGVRNKIAPDLRLKVKLFLLPP